MNPGKKKIIMIGSIPPPYHGSNIYFQNLISSRIRDEFALTHLDISDHRDLNNLSKFDFTNVKLALGSLLNLRKLIKQTQPDLIYIPVASNFLPYLRDGLFIIFSSYFSNAKIVIHLHEGNYFREVFYKNSTAPVKQFIKLSLSKADTAIVYSESLKSTFSGLVRNIVSFPNGMDFNISSTGISAGKQEKRKPVITFMGNLFESKGVLEVIKASVKVIDKIEDAVFYIAGTWTDKESQTRVKAEELIRKHKLDGNIIFKGVVIGKEKEKLFSETDIFVFPTYYPHEGCPLVIIEAMAHGKPVISTEGIGAINDVVTDKVTGYLIEKKNSDQLAELIIKLAEDKDLRERMGKAGKQKYDTEFTLEKNVQNVINTFYKVLN